MNSNIKKIIIALFIFILSTILIYMTCTINRVLQWCNDNQIILFNTNISDEFILNNVDKNKLNELGEIIGSYADTLELSKENKNFQEDKSFYLSENGNSYSIAEQFNPLGYSVWSYIQGEFATIFSLYIEFSFFAGLAISIAYIIISNKKINNILKFAFGYFGVILVVPQLYFYLFAHTFAGFEAYKIWDIRFYIVYTIVFILLFTINYIISKKMTQELNKAINNK